MPVVGSARDQFFLHGVLDEDAQLFQRVELRRWPVVIGGKHGFDPLIIQARNRTPAMFAPDRVEPRQVARLRGVPQTLEGGVLLVGRDQCRQRAVARSHDLGPVSSPASPFRARA